MSRRRNPPSFSEYNHGNEYYSHSQQRQPSQTFRYRERRSRGSSYHSYHNNSYHHHINHYPYQSRYENNHEYTYDRDYNFNYGDNYSNNYNDNYTSNSGPRKATQFRFKHETFPKHRKKMNQSVVVKKGWQRKSANDKSQSQMSNISDEKQASQAAPRGQGVVTTSEKANATRLQQGKEVQGLQKSQEMTLNRDRSDLNIFESVNKFCSQDSVSKEIGLGNQGQNLVFVEPSIDLNDPFRIKFLQNRELSSKNNGNNSNSDNSDRLYVFDATAYQFYKFHDSKINNRKYDEKKEESHEKEYNSQEKREKHKKHKEQSRNSGEGVMFEKMKHAKMMLLAQASIYWNRCLVYLHNSETKFAKDNDKIGLLIGGRDMGTSNFTTYNFTRDRWVRRSIDTQSPTDHVNYGILMERYVCGLYLHNKLLVLSKNSIISFYNTYDVYYPKFIQTYIPHSLIVSEKSVCSVKQIHLVNSKYQNCQKSVDDGVEKYQVTLLLCTNRQVMFVELKMEILFYNSTRKIKFSNFIERRINLSDIEFTNCSPLSERRLCTMTVFPCFVNHKYNGSWDKLLLLCNHDTKVLNDENDNYPNVYIYNYDKNKIRRRMMLNVAMGDLRSNFNRQLKCTILNNKTYAHYIHF